MFVPSKRQGAALTELINIAYTLTASKLSEVSGYRVFLDIPLLNIHPMDALFSELDSFMTEEIASVHQVFTGPLSGDALLMLDHNGAVMLSNLLVAEQLRVQHLDFASREILIGAGTMLLGACLGLFGNLLELRVSCSLPRLYLERLSQFFSAVSIERDTRQYAVLVTTSFHIRQQNVSGRLLIVLGHSSLERLVEAAERWDD